ncbi:hypothetical protein CHISP_1297 [Chitinispirillum alkaliphilum]|nr:hypothetical protein CHISP_1297 [Chitinispirillum alkaliphilum]
MNFNKMYGENFWAGYSYPALFGVCVTAQGTNSETEDLM